MAKLSEINYRARVEKDRVGCKRGHIMIGRVLVVSQVSLFPPEHGGAKNIRSILESLAYVGIACRVLVKMQPKEGSKMRFAGQHPADLEGIAKRVDGNLLWESNGVQFLGVSGGSEALSRAAAEEVEKFKPDAFFLSDDGLEDTCDLFDLGAGTGRLVYLAQTIHCLPFGPYSILNSPGLSESVRKAKRIIAPSEFAKTYIFENLGVNSQVYYPNVFGHPPFPTLGNIRNEFITMINPCPWKGSSIFVQIVKSRPDLQFAAVPTWGITAPLLEELKSLPNLTLLKETQEIDEIFKRTKILLAPSLCQEALGLVSPEALLRGIPVIASDIGGLREANLGVSAMIRVTPIPFNRTLQREGHPQLGWDEPYNSPEPWSEALDDLLENEFTYLKTSKTGKEVAENFVRNLEGQSILPLLW